MNTKRNYLQWLLLMLVSGGMLAASEAPSENPLTVKGGRFLTLNTVIRVNQIEAARDLNEGEDEAAVHTPETVAAFRDAVSKGFPGAAVTWAFSWQALHDERPNYVAIRKQVVGYHKAYDDGFTRNGFGWVANCWEISLVKSLKPEVLESLTKWLQNVRQRWPDTKLVTQGEFGEAWRREHPDNSGVDYHFVQRGTGIGGSETNLEIRWFMNPDFRLAILRDWQKDEPGKVIDFTRYDLPAREPADPSADKPSRNWSLINRINQKQRRPEDAPLPLKDLTQEEQLLIKKRHPELF